MKKALLVGVVMSSLVWAQLALCDTVLLTANDAINTSSFNAAGNWSNGQPPGPGNDYVTQGYLLRTPATAGNYTFAGDSLRVGGGTGGGPFLTDGNVNANSFINKTPSAPIITVNNLILDASYIRDGMGSSDVWTLAGNITVTANGGGFAAQCRFNVDSAIHGSGTLYIADNGSGEAARTIYINSPANTYAGSIILVSRSGRPNNNYSRLTFSDDSRMNFVIGPSGVNNSITGWGTLTLNGDFYFDLSGAGNNHGDTWTIIGMGPSLTVSYGDTFSVIGFNRVGGGTGPGLWLGEANSVTYTFDTATGILAVPEPSVYGIALVGLAVAALLRRRIG